MLCPSLLENNELYLVVGCYHYTVWQMTLWHVNHKILEVTRKRHTIMLVQAKGPCAIKNLIFCSCQLLHLTTVFTSMFILSPTFWSVYLILLAWSNVSIICWRFFCMKEVNINLQYLCLLHPIFQATSISFSVTPVLYIYLHSIKNGRI